MRAATLSLLLLGFATLFVASSAASRRSLAADALTPTQRLNQERQAQLKAESQKRASEAQRRKVETKKSLGAPCFVPTAWYPISKCSLEKNPSTCGRGWNAWASYAECCRPGAGAFVKGCTDLEQKVECYVAGDYWPRRTCALTTNLTRCLENWGRWGTREECCAPGNAHLEGCSRPQPCWAARDYYPERRCGRTADQAVCGRGWGAWPSQWECCEEGSGFSDGCTEYVPEDEGDSGAQKYEAGHNQSDQ